MRCSISFTCLQPKLETRITAAGLGVFHHGGHGVLTAYDDQQLRGTGDGGIQNAAGQQVRRAVPAGQNHGAVL